MLGKHYKLKTFWQEILLNAQNLPALGKEVGRNIVNELQSAVDVHRSITFHSQYRPVIPGRNTV